MGSAVHESRRLRDFKKQRRCLSLGHKVFLWSASLRCLAAMSVFSALVTRSWGNSNSRENNGDPRWDEDVWSGTGWEVEGWGGADEPQVVCWGPCVLLLWSAHTLGSQHTHTLVGTHRPVYALRNERAQTHSNTHIRLNTNSKSGVKTRTILARCLFTELKLEEEDWSNLPLISLWMCSQRWDKGSDVLYVRFSKENDARPPVPSSGLAARASVRGTYRTWLEDTLIQEKEIFKLRKEKLSWAQKQPTDFRIPWLD